MNSSMSAVLNDPRTVLNHNIQSRSSLPGDLLGCLSANRGTVLRSNSPVDNEIAHLKNTMDNPYVNYSEGERIAAAVLEGKTVPVSTSGQVVHRPHRELRTQTDWGVRHSTRLNFLELVSDTAPVHEINIVNEMKKTKSSRETRKQGFTWAGEYVENKPEVFNITRDTELNRKRDHELKVMSIAHAQTLSKKSALGRNREEVRNIRTESVRLRDEMRKANMRKLDEKKRLATVREKLYEKLKATNDPLLGPIMRCADNAFLHSFMEDFKGYSMSVDAIIALLGKTLGSDRHTAKPTSIDTKAQETLAVDKAPRALSPKHPSPHSNTAIPHGLGAALPDLKVPAAPPAWGRSVNDAKMLGSGYKSKGSDFRRSPAQSPLRGGERTNSLGNMRLVSSAQTSDELIHMFGDDEDHISSMMSISTTDNIADKAVNAMRTQLLEEGNLPSAQAEKILTDAQIHEIGSAPSGRAKKTEKILQSKLNKSNKRLGSQNMNNFSNIKLDKNHYPAGATGLGGGLEGGQSMTLSLDSSGHFETGVPLTVKVRVTEAPEIAVPKAIKTVESDQPVLLYNSFAEQTKFLAANVAAGAGLPLWGNRSVQLHERKYKPQKGTNIRSAASMKMKEKDAHRRLPVMS